MYNREHKYRYWREERKKGKWHYIMKSFALICCALLVGKLIGLMIFDHQPTVDEFVEMLPAYFFIMLLVGFPISVIGWHHEESKFFRALKRREKASNAQSEKNNKFKLP